MPCHGQVVVGCGLSFLLAGLYGIMSNFLKLLKCLPVLPCDVPTTTVRGLQCLHTSQPLTLEMTPWSWDEALPRSHGVRGGADGFEPS